MDLNARLAKRMEATEKIATEYERNHVRDAMLAAGGVGVAVGASNINSRPVNKRKANLKNFLALSGKIGIYAGAGNAALGQGMAAFADHAAKKTKNIGEGMALRDAAYQARDLRNQGLMNAVGGVGALGISKRIHPNPLNKKRLAAKLGLITGGTVAAAAGAHGLLNKEAANETEKVAKDEENNNVRNGVLFGSGLAAIDVGAGINHKPTSKVRKALKTGLRIHGGYNVAAGTLAAGGAEYVRRTAATPAIATKAGVLRNKGLAYTGIGAAELIGSKYINTNPVNKKRLAAKLGLITGGAVAAAAGAHGLMSEKKASKEDKKNPPSGWNRLARGFLGHIALPAIGATSVLAGAGLGVAADNVRNPYLKGALYGTGSLLTLGGIATAGPGPLLNDSYQAYRYIQEH